MAARARKEIIRQGQPGRKRLANASWFVSPLCGFIAHKAQVSPSRRVRTVVRIADFFISSLSLLRTRAATTGGFSVTIAPIC
jgi:hypothetical protein